MRQQKLHLFIGTVDRYIAENDDRPGNIELILSWKRNEMPDEETYQQQLEAFKADFGSALNWDEAQYSTKTVLMHT